MRLKNKSTPELLSLFEVLRLEAADEGRSVRKRNKAMDQVRKVLGVLKDRGKEAEDAMRKFLNHDVLEVRIGAAYFLLRVDPEAACKALEEIVAMDRIESFNAMMLLQEYRNGRLKMDY